MKLTSPDSDGLTDEEFEEYKTLTTEAVINERKVLKIGSSQPQEPMMPMGDDMGMGNEMPMDGDPNMMGPDGGSEFDTNFDAGVEADEDEDPKKYIQQLTGKLSQELGKYNNELGEPDIELSKYVGGMITKQVAKYLDDSGKKDLIKKIKTTDSSNDSEDVPMNDNVGEMPEDENMAMESYRLTKNDVRKLFETFNNDIEKREENLLSNNIKMTKGNKPFSSPKFKK
jgi:hypothetical protein